MMQKEVSIFDVTALTRLAEVCGEFLKKGRGVRVVGRLKQDGEPAAEEEKPADGAEEETEEAKEAASF